MKDDPNANTIYLCPSCYNRIFDYLERKEKEIVALNDLVRAHDALEKSDYFTTPGNYDDMGYADYCWNRLCEAKARLEKIRDKQPLNTE